MVLRDAVVQVGREKCWWCEIEQDCCCSEGEAQPSCSRSAQGEEDYVSVQFLTN